MTWKPLVPAALHRQGVPVEPGPNTDAWVNDQYIVHRRTITSDNEGQPPMFHLSIRNQDHGARHDWRDFQRIKNQLAGEEYEGVELYPAESNKMDTANQFHIWAFPFHLGIGWEERMVTDHDVSSTHEPGAVQRDNEPVDGPLNTLEEVNEWGARVDADQKAAESDNEEETS